MTTDLTSSHDDTGTPDTADAADAQDAARTTAWRQLLVRIGAVYLFSRVCVLVGAAVVAAELRADANRVSERTFRGPVPFADPHYAGKGIPENAAKSMLDVLTSWDGIWYLRIVRNGYPRTIRPDVTYEVADARAAFFPTYPNLVRAVDWILPGGDTAAALLTNFVLGALAIVLVGVLAREYFDHDVAERAMVLMALFPGSFVLSFAYTEALLLVAAAGCLLALHRCQWLLAGVLAAVGTATRPNGIALVAACAVASMIAIRARREWRSLVAPALAPVGFIGFQWWIGAHTGEAGVWFRVQREAWDEGTSFGLTALRNTVEAFTHPLSSPTDTITAASVATLAVLLYMAWKRRLPLAPLAYCAVIVALMLLPSTVTARPRFVYTAFPLLICAAAYFGGERQRRWWPYVIGACCTGLTGLTALFGVYGAIP